MSMTIDSWMRMDATASTPMHYERSPRLRCSPDKPIMIITSDPVVHAVPLRFRVGVVPRGPCLQSGTSSVLHSEMLHAFKSVINSDATFLESRIPSNLSSLQIVCSCRFVICAV